MLSNKTKRFYHVQTDNHVYKLNINKTDRTLNTIITLGTKLKTLLKDTYKDSPELANLLYDEVLTSGMDYDEGHSCVIDTMVENAKLALHTLHTHHDEMPIEKETLHSLGFIRFGHFLDNRICHECILENDDNHQVAEEIVEPVPGKLIHRLRTITWKPDKIGVKSSDTITYKTLRMNKKLQEAALAEKGKHI